MAKGKEKGTEKPKAEKPKAKDKRLKGGVPGRRGSGARYPDAFKARAVKAAQHAQARKHVSVTAIAKEFGITHQILYKWMREAKAAAGESAQ